MKLRIAVCDDLRSEQLQLASYIRNYCHAHGLEAGIKLYSSGEELLDSFFPGMFHIVFLDIYMNGISGVDTARKIRESDRTCAIIFATTSEDHGVVSYEVLASDYLVKPICEADVESAMDWCVDQLRASHRFLSISCDNGTAHMALQDIQYVEIQGHTAVIHTIDRVLTTRRVLDELEREIGHTDFLRCHRSFLVNMNHIQRLEKNAFRLNSGEMIPIGSSVMAKIKERFMSWFFVKTWAKK